MVDVTQDNYATLLPQVLEDVRGCSFLAIDTEFTGLLAHQTFSNNLFDDGQRRYQKLCGNLRRFSVVQLGLAVFTGIADTNAYSVRSYNFYLRPHSCASSDPIIACQTSSLEFLQKVNFDFNKWLYEGVVYMNADEVEDLRTELVSLFNGKKALHMSFEIERHYKEVGSWMASAKDGDTHTVVAVQDIHAQALLLAALHNTPGLWATLLHDQFHRKLPDSYAAFKSDVHVMFPALYDTKFVAEELKNQYRENKNVGRIFNKTSLGELAAAVQGELPVMYPPKLRHLPTNNKYSQDGASLHEAGYDAFLTGLCFVRISHLFAMSLDGRDPSSKRPPWLVVQGQSRALRVSPGMVSAALAKYGHFDVQRLNNTSVLVATASWRSLTEILANVSSEGLKAQVYTSLRHSTLARSVMWSSAVLSTGLGVWLAYKSFKKSSP
ncbi:Pre-piRNA 3'-exonuclease trimmer [Chionoecetes opilio]|uniref:Pre-piRNA 3'-exonuclease trimmer n=1 Tax=Chionoecetes opilio TaxID=41210 RepID=A0A8J5CNJ5_CHIOP|nr:Pre-piRNA 3'-exonuclease trimmer [Chionoecetes opilio]